MKILNFMREFYQKHRINKKWLASIWELYLYAFYIGGQLFSPIFNAFAINISGWKFLAWAPMSMFTNGVLDTINQNYGRQAAHRVVTTGLFVRMTFYLGVMPALFGLMLYAHVKVPNTLLALIQQSFWNFLIQEGMSFGEKAFIDIPLFHAAKKRLPFFLNTTLTTLFSNSTKTALQTFFQYVGKSNDLVSLVLGTTITKQAFIAAGGPVGFVLNRITRKING